MTLPNDASQAGTPTVPATPVSNEKLLEYIVKLNKRIKKLEAAVGAVPENVNLSDWLSEAFQKISDVETHENELVDEAIDKADRAQRAVRRLKKEYDDHEHED